MGYQEWRKWGPHFQESSPYKITKDGLNSFSNKLWQHVWNEFYRNFIRDSMLKISTGLLFNWHSPSGMYQNSRLPEGKRVFSIHHVVCACLGAVNHPYPSENGENTHWTQVPRHQPRAQCASRAFLGIESQACCVVSVLCRSAPRSAIARSHDTLYLTFYAKLFSKAIAAIFISTSNWWGFQFLHSLANTCYCPSCWLQPS